MRTWSGSETVCIPLSLRMRSDFFFVRMWFLCECLLFTLPVEVKRKLFFAPEWDLIFVMGWSEGGAYVPQA